MLLLFTKNSLSLYNYLSYLQILTAAINDTKSCIIFIFSASYNSQTTLVVNSFCRNFKWSRIDWVSSHGWSYIFLACLVVQGVLLANTSIRLFITSVSGRGKTTWYLLILSPTVTHNVRRILFNHVLLISNEYLRLKYIEIFYRHFTPRILRLYRYALVLNFQSELPRTNQLFCIPNPNPRPIAINDNINPPITKYIRYCLGKNVQTIFFLIFSLTSCNRFWQF